MSVSDTEWPTSPLAAVDTAFAALTCQPAPLTLDLDVFDPESGLPRGDMNLPALRDWLLRHPRAYPARDAVWRELIRRARLDGPQWVIAARLGVTVDALRMRLGRIDTRIADALAAGLLTGVASPQAFQHIAAQARHRSATRAAAARRARSAGAMPAAAAA